MRIPLRPYLVSYQGQLLSRHLGLIKNPVPLTLNTWREKRTLIFSINIYKVITHVTSYGREKKEYILYTKRQVNSFKLSVCFNVCVPLLIFELSLIVSSTKESSLRTPTNQLDYLFDLTCTNGKTLLVEFWTFVC